MSPRWAALHRTAAIVAVKRSLSESSFERLQWRNTFRYACHQVWYQLEPSLRITLNKGEFINNGTMQTGMDAAAAAVFDPVAVAFSAAAP